MTHYRPPPDPKDVTYHLHQSTPSFTLLLLARYTQETGAGHQTDGILGAGLGGERAPTREENNNSPYGREE